MSIFEKNDEKVYYDQFGQMLPKGENPIKLKYSIKSDQLFCVDNKNIKSDAYISKFDLKKRDQKSNRKMRKRIKKSLRLKPMNVIDNKVNERLA